MSAANELRNARKIAAIFVGTTRVSACGIACDLIYDILRAPVSRREKTGDRAALEMETPRYAARVCGYSERSRTSGRPLERSRRWWFHRSRVDEEQKEEDDNDERERKGEGENRDEETNARRTVKANSH